MQVNCLSFYTISCNKNITQNLKNKKTYLLFHTKTNEEKFRVLLPLDGCGIHFIALNFNPDLRQKKFH